MKYSYRSSLVLGVWMALICAGCASYPEAELKEATAAMDRAKAQQVDVFAAGNWAEAMKAWDEAQSQLSQQKYALAKPSLLRAKSRFEKAEQIASAKREEVLNEIRNAQRTSNSRFAGLRNDFAAARLPASVRADLEQCCRELEQQIEKLNMEVDRGDLAKAQATAKETLSKVYEGELKLQAALKKR